MGYWSKDGGYVYEDGDLDRLAVANEQEKMV